MEFIDCMKTNQVPKEGSAKWSFPMPQEPLVGHNLPIFEASCSHSDTPHSVRLLRTSDQPDAETSV